MALYIQNIYWAPLHRPHLSHLMTKPTKWYVRPAKTQISLGIRPNWSESLLCAQWIAKNPSFLHADSKDSDQNGRMPMLIGVFAGSNNHFVGLVIRQLNFEDKTSIIDGKNKLSSSGVFSSIQYVGYKSYFGTGFLTGLLAVFSLSSFWNKSNRSLKGASKQHKRLSLGTNCIIVMILSFRTAMTGQTVQT